MSDSKPNETEQLVVEVDKHTKQVAKEKLEHGGLTRVVRDALAREAHGEQTTEIERVKDRLQELRDERREKQQQRDVINRELDQLDIEIERAENRLDELRDRQGEYEGALKALEETLEDGQHVFPDHGVVERAAAVGDCEPEDVIADLKDRNPDIPDEQFSQATTSSSIV